MSLEYIRDAILADARAEAGRIEATARANRQERLEAARKSLDAEFARRLDRARRDAEQEARRRLMVRRSEHNLKLLKRRNEILDEVFEEAAGRFCDLPDEDYRSTVAVWMKELPADAGGEVLCSERDTERLAPLIEELNASRGPQARLKLVRHSEPLRGGVLFRAERFELDLSLDARLAQLREALAPEVAAVTFTGDLTV